jgi:hypothetical protein
VRSVAPSTTPPTTRPPRTPVCLPGKPCDA